MSTKTIDQYKKVLVVLKNKGLNYEECTDSSHLLILLKNLKATNSDNYISEATLKKYLISLVWYYKNNNNDVILDGLREEMKKISEKQVINSNNLTDKESKNYLKWDQIMKRYNELEIDLQKKKKIAKSTYKNYVIFSLYVLMPPRRILDYALMKITDNDPLDNNFNYFNKSTTEFIFNVYKTKESLGVQKIKISQKLNDILINYITKYNVSSSLLELTEGLIGDHLSRMINKDKKIRVNILRHSYISYLSDTGKLSDCNMRKAIAYMMGHSESMQNKYYKITDKERKKANDITGEDVLKLSNQ